VIVEIDGVLFDSRAAYWEAYSRAVTAVGLARTDEPTLWRLVRTGADDGQLIRGAKPHQLDKFRQAFDAVLEADEIIASLVPHDDMPETMRILRDLGPMSAVTNGANVAARHRLLRENSLTDAFPQLTQAPQPASAGAAALLAITARHPDDKLAVVFAATANMVRAADEAELIPIGITSGPAIAKRLASAGARATYSDLAAFAAALAKREEPLRRAGLTF
jgi:beta-phosphoglucomutase-like phosphatase (HAD superfamily)